MDGYKLKIKFSDGHTNVFDYKTMVTSDHKEFSRYADLKRFKKFKIVNGNTSIAWGEFWHMILTPEALYSQSRLNMAKFGLPV